MVSIMTFQRFVLHIVSTGAMLYGFKSLEGLQVFPEMQAQYGGFWQYLTIQGLALAGLIMVVSLVLDTFPSLTVFYYIKRVLLLIALPLTVVISSIYWTLILLVPKLILLKVKEISDDTPSANAMMEMLFYIPLDMDLCLHAVPAVALTIDFFLFERRYGKRGVKLLAPLLALLYTIGYGLWVEHCGSNNNGVFPYPFLTENTFHTRLVIYTGAGLIAPLSFWLLNSLHH